MYFTETDHRTLCDIPGGGGGGGAGGAHAPPPLDPFMFETCDWPSFFIVHVLFSNSSAHSLTHKSLASFL